MFGGSFPSGGFQDITIGSVNEGVNRCLIVDSFDPVISSSVIVFQGGDIEIGERHLKSVGYKLLTSFDECLEFWCVSVYYISHVVSPCIC